MNWARYPASNMFRLESPRLALRTFEDRDLEAFIRYRSDPEVARYQGWEVPYPRDKAVEFLERAKAAVPAVPGQWYPMALERKDNGEMIGECAFCLLPDGQQAEMTITLSRAHQGQGLAREALERLLEYLFGELKLHRVRANTDVENHPSWQLMVRLGMRLEGTFVQSLWLKGHWASEYAYAILREEWEQKRRGTVQPGG
ncbi:N-acetyltransferase [Meiothermus sp. PNK-Is4]|nr:N-acetyltransferase [Meiothermus sp. Pnk-1]RYM36414.1 N-acetyltransferase [Meiothermus sp. PNK-Is4]